MALSITNVPYAKQTLCKCAFYKYNEAVRTRNAIEGRLARSASFLCPIADDYAIARIGGNSLLLGDSPGTNTRGCITHKSRVASQTQSE